MSEEAAISDKLISFNLFDKKNIRKIKIDFKRKEEGLEKEHFISIMLHHLKNQSGTPAIEPEKSTEGSEEFKREQRFSRVLELERTAKAEKISLVAALSDLFAEIDVNDDKHLE